MWKCNLRCACIIIAIVSLLTSGGILLAPKINFVIIVSVVLGVVLALPLLFGAINKDERLMLVALISSLLNLIFDVIALLGTYFDFGGFRDIDPSASVNEWLLSFLFGFVLQCIFTYVIYSYYNELHGSGDD